MPRAHQVGTHLRELSFLEVREPLEQDLAGHEAEHGIAEELELLVVRGAGALVGACLRLVRV